MLNWPQKYKLIGALSQKIMEMIKIGDFVIKDEIAYFENHTRLDRRRAEELYQIFEAWALAQDPPIETTHRNFFRALFITIGRLKAHDEIIIKVTKLDCSLWLIKPNQPQA